MRSIVIPVKELPRSKLRLASTIAPDARVALGLAMFQDILDVVLGSATAVVVSSDAQVLHEARTRGCSVLADPGGGLNEAVDAATSEAMMLGSSSVLVIPADVPLIAVKDVEALLDARCAVSIAASADGGTNALLRRPPDCIPASFGHESAAAHLHLARAAGLTAEVLDLESFRLDVDSPDDVAQLAKAPGPQRSVSLARSLVSPAEAARAPAPS